MRPTRRSIIVTLDSLAAGLAVLAVAVAAAGGFVFTGLALYATYKPKSALTGSLTPHSVPAE